MHRAVRIAAAAGVLVSAQGALAQPGRGDPSEHLPRNLTDAERAYLVEHPLVAVRGGGGPTGPVWCPPEYAPTEAIMMSWSGSNSWKTILAKMAAEITTVGDAEVIIAVATNNTQNSAANLLQSYGTDMGRVRFVVKRLDSIWMRDYGPRFVYEGGVRVIVDHTYNRPRPLDNGWPDFFASEYGFAAYDIPLIHGGGNFHLSGLGDAYSTRLIANENPGLSDAEIVGLWQEYQSLDTELVTPLRQSIDSTQHIDMWAILTGDREVVVSDWPLAPGSFEDNVCDGYAADMAAAGYTVRRVPAVSTGGTHYTFTNAVICNDLVLVPSYTNPTASQYNTEALATWEAACPDKTIVQIPSQAIVTAAGVLHCIVMHVPEPSGGSDPAIYVRSLNEGGTFEPGDRVEIQWIADDDIDTYYIKLELSLDSGETWPIVIDGFQVDDGTYMWTVPGVFTTRGRIRATVFDLEEGTGFDLNDMDFTISNSGGCVADFDNNGTVNTQDMIAFLGAWAAGDGSADINNDGYVNTFDVTAFLNAWVGGC